MNNRSFLVGLLITVPHVLAVPTVNGSFEDGLSGWTLDTRLEGGGVIVNRRAFEQLILDTSQIHHASARTTSRGGATDGLVAAEIQSAEYSEFNLFSETGDFLEQYFGPYTVFLYQDITLTAGDILSGSAKFQTGETLPEFADYARVTVDDSSVWQFGISDLPSDGGSLLEREGPWQTWQFIAPSDGTYRLKLELFQDDELMSWGFFDGIRASANVPDATATAGLFAIGLMGLVLARKKLM